MGVLLLVRIEGLEPSRREASEPKSDVYANFTISAYGADDRIRTYNTFRCDGFQDRSPHHTGVNVGIYGGPEGSRTPVRNTY